jgi:hypothetical protein
MTDKQRIKRFFRDWANTEPKVQKIVGEAVDKLSNKDAQALAREIQIGTWAVSMKILLLAIPCNPDKH